MSRSGQRSWRIEQRRNCQTADGVVGENAISSPYVYALGERRRQGNAGDVAGRVPASVGIHTATEPVLPAVIMVHDADGTVVRSFAGVRVCVVAVGMDSRNGMRVPVRDREQPEDQGQNGRYDHERAQYRNSSSLVEIFAVLRSVVIEECQTN